MLQKIAPILIAINIQETNLFYRNKLKFLTYYYGDYLVVKKDNIEIHFLECTDERNFFASGCCIFNNNIEDLFAEFSSMDMIRPAGVLKPNSRGKKEFIVFDNNEHELRFCEI